MKRSWIGPTITAIVVGGVAFVLYANWQGDRGDRPSDPTGKGDKKAAPNTTARILPSGFREYPIGEPIDVNHMSIAAVWLPSVGMDGAPSSDTEAVIHLEADVRSLPENPQGFAKDEFIPYLKVSYAIEEAAGGKVLGRGEMLPMVARDGLHYGANIPKPAPGSYRLTYEVKPPSAGGLGRHSDPVTGVAPWWPEFRATFEWDLTAAPSK